ncbi:MAG: AAA domain-containing protein, partial [Gemmataceae bacterium]
LSQAASAGVVYAHQLPGWIPKPAPLTPPTTQLLLPAHEEPAPVLPDAVVSYRDTALDACQRLAVARALAAPLGLVAGPPATGKSRVLAEMVYQARQRGWRVLLLAPSAAGLEAVLRFVEHPQDWLSLVPLQGDYQQLHTHTQQLHAQAVSAARQALAHTEHHLAVLPSEAELQTRVLALLAEYQQAEHQRTQWEQQAADAAGPPASSSAQSDAQHWSQHPLWQAQQSHFDQLRQSLHQRVQTCQQQRQHIDSQTEHLRTQYDALLTRQQARQSNNWVSPAYWASWLAGDPSSALAECQRRQDELHTQRAVLDAELEALSAELATLQRQENQFAEMIREQIRQQQAAEQARQQEQWQQQRQQWWTRWKQLLGLPERPSELPLGLPAVSISPEPSEQAVAAWREYREQVHHQLQSLQQMHKRWLQAIEQHPFEVALRSCSGVVVTTLPCLPRQGYFDLVLVDEAHRLSDADLLAATALGQRCTLVGDPAAALEANRFTHCWQQWFCDPRPHAIRWKYEGDKLVAVLGGNDEFDRNAGSVEPVFDRPEVELWIVQPPGGEPRLGEVRFPASTSLSEAWEFLVRHGETRLSDLVRPNVAWRQFDSEVRLECFTDAIDLSIPSCETDTKAKLCFTLETGVCEHLISAGTAGFQTAALVFDTRAGWTAQRVRQWCRERLGWCPSDRATLLDRPYRVPGLVSFVSVPARGTVGRSAPLEVELRQSEELPGPPWLPPEIRSQLPASGLVNPTEASVIVDLLTEWFADPTSLAWCERQSKEGGHRPVAVLTPYAAQAVLLRGLIRRAELHPRFEHWLEVSTLEEYRQRECGWAIVSLTRSDPHRLVHYGEAGDELALALTRATERLVFVGDAVTLARRVQRGEPHSLESRLARQVLCLCTEAPAASPPRPIRSRESSTV